MTPIDREQHMRRMLDHGEKVREEFKRDRAEFERDCRAFWDYMRRALQEKNT